MAQILAWHSFWDPRILLNPLRPLVQYYYGKIVDAYIHRELEKRFAEVTKERSLDSDSRDWLAHKPIKSIITMALQGYLDQGKTKDTLPESKLDKTFATYTASQIRVFIFAGTDTSSTNIVFIYHMLSKHPKWLKKVQDEHDQVFGLNPNDAAHCLKENASLLNQCSVTVAVIKETLRL